MFDDCTSLAELNAARIKAVNSGKDLITVNNAYNKRRQEIMSQRNDFKKLQPIFIKAVIHIPLLIIDSILESSMCSSGYLVLL